MKRAGVKEQRKKFTYMAMDIKNSSCKRWINVITKPTSVNTHPEEPSWADQGTLVIDIYAAGCKCRTVIKHIHTRLAAYR